MLVLGMFLFTLGEIVSMPVAAGLVANLAPPNMRGALHGNARDRLVNRVGPLGRVAGMWLLGTLAHPFCGLPVRASASWPR